MTKGVKKHIAKKSKLVYLAETNISQIAKGPDSFSMDYGALSNFLENLDINPNKKTRIDINPSSTHSSYDVTVYQSR